MKIFQTMVHEIPPMHWMCDKTATVFHAGNMYTNINYMAGRGENDGGKPVARLAEVDQAEAIILIRDTSSVAGAKVHHCQGKSL